MKTISIFLRPKYLALVGIFCLTIICLTAFSVSAAAVRSGFNTDSLPANDDGSTDAVPLGFSVDFFGTTYSSVYVNNNGNVTFNGPLGDFTPTPFGDVGQPIIAPFWADVDTRGSGSGITRYGTGTVNSRNAFGITWINVGYYNSKFDKLNSFQLIIIDRSDRATGAFDVEFNYNSILWETGDASNGTNGLGGFSARAGFSDGTVNDLELQGSGVNGAFLNSNSATGLKNNSRNSTVLGRYVFEFPLQARVTKVEYEQINGGTSPIDNNPNIQGGRRIFPDKDTPTDGVDRRKIRVKAQYGLNSAGTRIYFRNFDLDDPSANSAPIDDEPTANAGDDNNGNVDGTANTRAGQLSVPSPNPNSCQAFTGGVSCLTDANGTATVDFTTTRQPGDNFTVAASANQTYLSELTLAANGIDLKDTSNVQTPVTTTAANACATSSVRACRAEMLTVWRRLHIEVDSMGVVTGNNVTGMFPTNKKVNPGNVTLSLNVSGSGLDINRFENGRIEIGTRSFRIINSDSLTDANTTNTVTISNNFSAFQITAGDTFTLYDDDDFNDNDTTSLDGDAGSEDVTQPSLDLIQSNDTACNVGVDGKVSNLCNSLLPAYVIPKYDLSGSNQNIPFSLNITTANVSNIYNNYFNNLANEASVDFWTIYMLGGYQYITDEDSDPDESDATWGIATSNIGIVSFIELNRATEYEDLDNVRPAGIDVWRNRPIESKYNTIHELGHLFDGQHEDCLNVTTGMGNAGVMANFVTMTRGVYCDVTIDKIRGGTGVLNP